MLLQFPQDELPDTVYVELLRSSIYFEKAEEVAPYRHLLQRLQTTQEED